MTGPRVAGSDAPHWSGYGLMPCWSGYAVHDWVSHFIGVYTTLLECRVCVRRKDELLIL